MKNQFVIIFLAGCSSVWAQAEFDAVAKGKEVFENMGCAECHVVAKNDDSLKTGPSLFGLFLNKPREREIGVVGSDGRKKVKADKAYFLNSVRKSWDALAVAESGPTSGETYLPVMPMYTQEVISDHDVESVWHYLRTLADEDTAGPATVMLKEQKQPQPKSLLEIPNEVWVAERPRVFRAPLINPLIPVPKLLINRRQGALPLRPRRRRL
jgi:cytochrome c2